MNYLYGLPHYAVSIAAARGRRQVVAGVVRSPALDVEYAATLGGGATCNGVPLQVRTAAPPLDQALVATGFGYETAVRDAPGAVRWPGCCPQVRDIRRQGSCALDLCAVAAGQCDAYVEEGAHLWDYAAGGLVATEAGATFEVWTTDRRPGTSWCARPRPVGPVSPHSVRACGFLGDESRS